MLMTIPDKHPVDPELTAALAAMPPRGPTDVISTRERLAEHPAVDSTRIALHGVSAGDLRQPPTLR